MDYFPTTTVILQLVWKLSRWYHIPSNTIPSNSIAKSFVVASSISCSYSLFHFFAGIYSPIVFASHVYRHQCDASVYLCLGRLAKKDDTFQPSQLNWLRGFSNSYSVIHKPNCSCHVIVTHACLYKEIENETKKHSFILWILFFLLFLVFTYQWEVAKQKALFY